MTIDTLTAIKISAKRLGRAQRLQHFAALEIVARKLGQPHWRGLAEAYKHGWRPTTDQMDHLLPDDLNASVPGAGNETSELDVLGNSLVFTRWAPDDVAPMDADETHGELDGHPFYLVGDDFSVAIGSQGWEITLDQSPSATPMIRRLGGLVESIEALDPTFVERATQLVKVRARRMHAEVASAWPRRSTMPDREGRTQHPLGRGLSAEWHCLHCSGVHDGRTMAKTLWHCPDCGATPIDIFAEPFWNGTQQTA
ncbi:MAG: hypothetical protein ABIY37_08120 [Devosia sp.]